MQWKEAENFLRLVTAQSSNPDPFLKAYALATLGRLAESDFHYDEAIDLNKECLTIVRTLHAPPLEELVSRQFGQFVHTFGRFQQSQAIL